ncbi:MAG: hypothetical protein ACXWSD_03365 [Bdellovibrionota bacterium]
MRIAIISAVTNDWESVPALLQKLDAALVQASEHDASIWLIDDGTYLRPSFNSLSSVQNRVHVLELQGRHGPSRAISAALGYLTCERDEYFDGYILLGDPRPEEGRNITALLETAYLHPESIIFGKVNARTLSWRSRIARRCQRIAALALCGEALENSTLTYLHARAAESLVHCSHSGSDLEAAARRLKLPFICTSSAPGGPGRASSLALFEAVSVFREKVFARLFTASSFLFLISLLAFLGLAAARLNKTSNVSTSTLALAGTIPLLFAGASLLALLLGLGAHAINEVRRWTPALDSGLLIRSVNRVKRGPEAIAT